MLTHARTGSPLNVVRADGRRFASVLTPLERFRSYCRFEPETGCVIWTGATTRGRGKTALYPAFWCDGKVHRGHRWSAEHIHGLDVSDPSTQVDHCCPHIVRPNTLCVEHVQVVPASINRELQWIRVQVGLEPEPLPSGGPEPGAIPFYDPPAWLQLDISVKSVDGDCPF
jgi:hypothetical protein